MKRINIFVVALVWFSVAYGAFGVTVSVRDCGATGDGKQLDTKAIQAAIDKCAASGGGTTILPPGTYLSGTIYLKSRVTLHLEAGATLLGSTDLSHYPSNIPAIRSFTDYYVTQSLIAGENLENIGITGRGLIDGQGGSFRKKENLGYFGKRPFLIRLVNCRDVLVEGVRLQNSAMWMQHYLACERVTVRGIHVWNFSNANNDGIDLDGCRDCTVSQCVFESDDDGITLKSTFDRPSQCITISDCIARSHCNAIKCGTESNGGFKDITIANCVITSPRGGRAAYGHPRGLAGIALDLADGGKLERVAVSNITIQGVEVPIFFLLSDRGRPFTKGMKAPPVGSFKDVTLNNIVATEVGKVGCSITGQPGHSIENLAISNIAFTFEGGGRRESTTRKIPELPKNYPECNMFGELPAYGFYFRHVNGLRLSNVRLRTSTPDPRHAIVCEDVESLAVDGFDAACSPDGAAMLSLVQVRDAILRGSQPLAKAGTFLSLAGNTSRHVTLLGNDFSGVGRLVELAPEVPKDAVSLTGNREKSR